MTSAIQRQLLSEVELLRRIEARGPVLPARRTRRAMSGYRTIVADPPWKSPDPRGMGALAKSNGSERRPHEKRPLPYPTMTVDEITALPVSDLAADDARLFVWTTNHFLPATFAIIEAWGFTYAQTIVWHKTNPVPLPGSVTLKDVEFLLAARRGRVGQVYGARSSVLSAPVRAHSAKPEAFLDLVEQVSPGPYLELFARRQRLGWDTWGNEALEHVSLSTATASPDGQNTA